MSEKHTVRNIILIIVIAGVCVGTGYLLGTRRIDPNAELVEQLNAGIAELETANGELKAIIADNDRVIEQQYITIEQQHEYIGQLENNNQRLEDNNIGLIDNNRQLTDQQRLDWEYIGQLESNNEYLAGNNERLGTVLLAVTRRAGIEVDVNNWGNGGSILRGGPGASGD